MAKRKRKIKRLIHRIEKHEGKPLPPGEYIGQVSSVQLNKGGTAVINFQVKKK